MDDDDDERLGVTEWNILWQIVPYGGTDVEEFMEPMFRVIKLRDT